MGNCCQTGLVTNFCKKLRDIKKSNELTPTELRFLHKYTLKFKEKKMGEGF